MSVVNNKMYNFRKFALVLCCVLFCAVISVGIYSCGSDDTGPAGKIPVGVVLPLTGVNASTGLSMKIGMDIALEKLNGSLPQGRKIKFIVADSTPAGAKSSYQSLIDNHGVVAILGPFSSTATAEIIPVAQQSGVISFSPTSAAEGLSAKGSYIFRSSLTVKDLVSEGVKISKKEVGYSDVATIVNEADTFSSSNNETLFAEFDNYDDINVVSKQSFSRLADSALGDLTTELTAIKDSKPDALFISALPAGRIGVMVQARQLSIKAPLIYTLLTIDEVRKADATLSNASEGAITFQVWLPEVDTPQNAEFKSAHRAKYASDPDSNMARSYASVTILAEAIANSSGTDAESIRDSMAKIKNLDTVLGSFSFDENGDAVYDPVVAKVVNGKFEIIH